MTNDIPAAMTRLLHHPAVSLSPYEASIWPIAWETNDWGERVPAYGIDLALDRGWCCGAPGQHGLTIETEDDAVCAYRDLTTCDCSTCAYGADDAYSHEVWA